MLPISRAVAENNLLGALSKKDFALLQPDLEEWSGAAGAKIHDPGEEVTHAYFPCGSALACFIVILEDGNAVETGMVGREGVIGGIISAGGLPAFARAQVQSAGRFLRIETKRLDQAKSASHTLHGVFTHYSDCLLAQVLQSGACNATHTINQRTAKWLLAAMERTSEEEFSLTQDQLAAMLGVGRTYITRVIQAFKRQNLIETRRGFIRVRDERALRRVSCRCDEAVKRHFQSILTDSFPKVGARE